VVLRQILTSISISGTSINTPTTVARAAPRDKPKSIVEVAMVTSKWFETPIMAGSDDTVFIVFNDHRLQSFGGDIEVFMLQIDPLLDDQSEDDQAEK
jgi:hypothetical protein